MKFAMLAPCSVRHQRLLPVVFLIAAVFFCPCTYCGATELVSNGLLTGQGGVTPDGWQYVGWSQDPAASSFRWIKEASGLGVLQITNLKPNDSRWYQTFAAIPSTWYRASGWIRTDHVGTLPVGAYLSETNSWYSSEDLRGTHGWQPVEFWMKTATAQRSATLACRLGGSSSLNTGTAYFTALSFSETAGPPEDAKFVYGATFWDTSWRRIAIRFVAVLLIGTVIILGTRPLCSTLGEFATGLRRRMTRVSIAALGFLLLTHGGHFYSIDSYTVYLTAQAIVETGDLAISPGLATAVGRGGRSYGEYGIGQSLLQIPLVAAGSLSDALFPDTFAAIAGPNVSIFYPENFSVFAASLLGPLCGAIGAAALWAIAELLGYSFGVAAGLTIVLVASTQFWPAARDSFPHIVVACLLLLAVWQAMTWRDARFKAAPITLGCLCGLLILVRPFDAFLSLPLLMIYLLRQDWERVGRQKRFLNSNTGRFLMPVAVSVALVGLHNAVRFGSPMTFNESVGFGTPLLTGLYGLLLSVRRGIVFFSPPVVATVPGLIMLGRRKPAEAMLFAALIAVFPLGYATYSQWHGDLCWGPRFLVPILGFAVLPLGELLTTGAVGTALVATLGLAGFLVQIAGSAVDFQRASVPAFFSDPGYSQIIAQWRDLVAGKYLDWLPLRLYATHGLAAALAYTMVPLAMVTWATISLRRLIRSTNRADVSVG